MLRELFCRVYEQLRFGFRSTPKIGWPGPPFRWDEERRFLLRCELDAVASIMDTFPSVRRKDEAQFDGDYRTRRVILDIYDALAESIRTGQPYQTRLDPPPADPRCCHLPKGAGAS